MANFNSLSSMVILLASLLEKKGFAADRIAVLRKNFLVPTAHRVIADSFSLLGGLKALQLVSIEAGRNLDAWLLLLPCLPRCLFPKLADYLDWLFQAVRGWKSWYIYNCRPVRWIRNILSKRCCIIFF